MWDVVVTGWCASMFTLTLNLILIFMVGEFDANKMQFQDAAQRTWLIRRLNDMARLTGWETALACVIGCETSWVKAAEMGRGPPYERDDKIVGMGDLFYKGENPVLVSLESPDRRAKIHTFDRVHYALGVMSIDDELETRDTKSKNR